MTSLPGVSIKEHSCLELYLIQNNNKFLSVNEYRTFYIVKICVSDTHNEVGWWCLWWCDKWNVYSSISLKLQFLFSPPE